MKWYFASRMRHRSLVNEVISFVKSKNHSVVFDWSTEGSLKPYDVHGEECSRVAKNISDSLKDVDIFVLFSDEAGTDMFIELGLALANPKTKKIYVVGSYNARSLMHFHPRIIRINSLKELFLQEFEDELGEEELEFIDSFDQKFVS